MEEPVGVMECYECVEKHARDMEHHLEDIVRVTKEPSQRLKFEDWIDQVRLIRKFAHMKAKGISVNPADDEWKRLDQRYRAVIEAGKKPKPLTKPSGNPAKPLEIVRGEHTWTEVYRHVEECAAGSFRSKKPNPEHIITFCCPYGKWDETLPAGQQCLVGMTLQSLQHLHPEAQGSCVTCSGA